MATTKLRVQCIKRTTNTEAHKRIAGIGGVGAAARWYHEEHFAISFIESGIYEYYVLEAGVTTNVIIATREGKKYLKTEADAIIPDNLLALPDCP